MTRHENPAWICTYTEKKEKSRIGKEEYDKQISNHSLRSISKASKKSGAMSMFGVLTAHFNPGLPITVVSSIKNGIPLGIFVEK